MSRDAESCSNIWCFEPEPRISDFSCKTKLLCAQILWQIMIASSPAASMKCLLVFSFHFSSCWRRGHCCCSYAFHFVLEQNKAPDEMINEGHLLDVITLHHIFYKVAEANNYAKAGSFYLQYLRAYACSSVISSYRNSFYRFSSHDLFVTILTKTQPNFILS
jgi:hypothetical protein